MLQLTIFQCHVVGKSLKSSLRETFESKMILYLYVLDKCDVYVIKGTFPDHHHTAPTTIFMVELYVPIDCDKDISGM